jgi:hypothetical protein
MKHTQNETSSLAIEHFTTELLESRIEHLVGARVEYAIPENAVTKDEFELWCSNASSPIRIDTSLLNKGWVKVCGSFQLSKAASQRSLETAGFRDAFHRQAEARGLSSVRFVVDGGRFSIGASDFFNWLEKYDLGEIGWIGGNWKSEGEGAERYWSFVITRRIDHILDRRMTPRRPNLIVRWFIRLVGPVIGSHLMKKKYSQKDKAIQGS